VSQTENATPDSPPLSGAARLLWAALILATLYLCYFQNLGALGLVGPDEPRYAWIARDMAESGDWVTPRLYSKPWFEKPPLYYWGAALSFKLFGVSETTARLPSAICALLATLALAWLALRLYGAETARWLLVLLPTTVGMIGFSHAAATDMPFAAMLTIAMVFAARLLGLIPQSLAADSNSARSLLSFTSFTSSTSFTSLLFGFFLGLATLAKGPAALILSGGAVFLWAALTKRWRDAFRCLHPIAILGFCVTALPWYILCAKRNSDFFRVFIIEHNFKRFLTPEFQHIQPFWYYLPILLAAFLPWAILLSLSAAFGILRIGRERIVSPATALLCCWSLFCLLFFSISKSKLPGYILPAVPPIALLMVQAFLRTVPLSTKYFRWFQALWGFLLAVAADFLFFYLGRTHSSEITARASRNAGLILATFALANLLLATYWTRFESRIPIARFCTLPLLLLTLFVPKMLPGLFLYDPSGRTLAFEIVAQRLPADLYVGPMHRGQHFSLNFYLHREVETWDKENPKAGFLLMGSKFCQELMKPPWTCSNDPIYLPASGSFIFRVGPANSLDGLGGGLGRGSGGSAGGGLHNGQPR
jgi:4-amino-4-deoxy-L-arabinose transferase-like glycosyltransferase